VGQHFFRGHVMRLMEIVNGAENRLKEVLEDALVWESAATKVGRASAGIAMASSAIVCCAPTLSGLVMVLEGAMPEP